MERATTNEFFEWWYHNSDFGPANSDVCDSMKNYFIEEVGKNIPVGLNLYSDGETSTDKE